MAKADRSGKVIAGLKLPREIRKAPAIQALLKTPAGREALNDAFLEGAAVAAARVLEAHTRQIAEKEEARAARKAKGDGINGAAPEHDLETEAPQQVLMPEADPVPEPAEPTYRPGAAD